MDRKSRQVFMKQVLFGKSQKSDPKLGSNILESPCRNSKTSHLIIRSIQYRLQQQQQRKKHCFLIKKRRNQLFPTKHESTERSIFVNKRRATVFSSRSPLLLLFCLFWGPGSSTVLGQRMEKRSEGGPCCSALLGENPFSFNLRRGAEAEEEAERLKLLLLSPQHSSIVKAAYSDLFLPTKVHTSLFLYYSVFLLPSILCLLYASQCQKFSCWATVRIYFLIRKQLIICLCHYGYCSATSVCKGAMRSEGSPSKKASRLRWDIELNVIYSRRHRW